MKRSQGMKNLNRSSDVNMHGTSHYLLFSYSFGKWVEEKHKSLLSMYSTSSSWLILREHHCLNKPAYRN